MTYRVRKLPRLSGYDYSQNGYYFVTLCTHQKRHLFGSIHEQTINLNSIGKIVESELVQIPHRHQGVRLEAYTIMPNHLHCIIAIEKPKQSAEPPTLSNIIGFYKAGVSRQIHPAYPQLTIWQKSFYDCILRNDAAYLDILRYIEENPIKWESDEYY